MSFCYSWSEEGRVQQAWKLKQLSEWNIKLQTHHQHPPPPPRKKHVHPNHVRVFFFLMFPPGVCIWTTPARVGATIDRQLFWLHFFVVVLTVANFTFFKLFVYLCNCYHLCFFFVIRLLAEVYFRILWSPCK